MIEQELGKTPIRIKVKLKPSQWIGFNRWVCTIHGERREVPLEYVEWYCMSIEDSINSFKISEVDEFWINGKYM